ncbi:MAG TPA: histidine phosphatase family protein [Trebonia sp.]|jgi:probable phosphoglycerate mutase|nr:histidine phosphatase family protein [Trebonia sp.]
MNTFHIMRHGQSKANVAGIIVSCPESDRDGDYGLTEAGREQARAAAAGSGLLADTAIYSSDFARARETAEIVRARLGAPEVRVAPALRERCFGDWEGSATANYARVWAADEAGRRADGVEPPNAVLDRLTTLIAGLENEHEHQQILLVSHGDPLQILLAGRLHTDPALHRRIPHLETAEIRTLP